MGGGVKSGINILTLILLNISLQSKARDNIYYTMKKFILFCFTVFALATVQVQEIPYSKYINYSKEEFKDNLFKYYKNTNTWVVSKCNGFNEFVNVMAIIADAEEEVRPDQNDYTILAQMGENMCLVLDTPTRLRMLNQEI